MNVESKVKTEEDLDAEIQKALDFLKDGNFDEASDILGTLFEDDMPTLRLRTTWFLAYVKLECRCDALKEIAMIQPRLGGNLSDLDLFKYIALRFFHGLNDVKSARAYCECALAIACDDKSMIRLLKKMNSQSFLDDGSVSDLSEVESNFMLFLRAVESNAYSENSWDEIERLLALMPSLIDRISEGVLRDGLISLEAKGRENTACHRVSLKKFSVIRYGQIIAEIHSEVRSLRREQSLNSGELSLKNKQFEADNLVISGNQYFDQGEYTLAMHKYFHALQVLPTFDRAWNGLSLVANMMIGRGGQRMRWFCRIGLDNILDHRSLKVACAILRWSRRDIDKDTWARMERVLYSVASFGTSTGAYDIPLILRKHAFRRRLSDLTVYTEQILFLRQHNDAMTLIQSLLEYDMFYEKQSFLRACYSLLFPYGENYPERVGGKTDVTFKLLEITVLLRDVDKAYLFAGRLLTPASIDVDRMNRLLSFCRLSYRNRLARMICHRFKDRYQFESQ